MTHTLEAVPAELELLRSHDAATAEVLRIINDWSGELERVLEAITGVARRLCHVEMVFVGYPQGPGPEGRHWMGWRSNQGPFSMPSKAIEPALQRAEGVRLVRVVGRVQKITGEHPEVAEIARSQGKEEISFTAPHLSFAVIDSGIGMTEEQMDKLFQSFSQAEATTQKQYGGTGLGLAISRHFCRVMSGNITVTTTPGSGSTFTITLPRECEQVETAQ